MSYVVPIHRPSGARLALKLKFLDSQSETVVVAKANRLELYNFSPDGGLTFVYARAVYGYIIMLDALRPADSQTDHLFVGTDRHQYFTCSWDPQTRSIKTEQSFVDQADRTLRDTKENDRVHIDPTRRFMTLEMHDGIITVVPIVQQSTKKLRRDSHAKELRPGSLADPIPVRVEEISIRSSAFLDADEDSQEHPRLGVLWQDNQEEPQLKVVELQTFTTDGQPAADFKTVAELHDADQLDRGVTHLIPVSQPHGGFLVLGERSIAYVDSNLTAFSPQSLHDDHAATVWSCWTQVDSLRWLLADDYGNLYFLMLNFQNNSTIGKWQLDKLDAGNRTSKASCLIYLDAGLVFVGSHSGDSQLVRIVERGVEIVQVFSNIAPIIDAQLMDLGRGAESAMQTGEFSTGQARLVTCSGSWQDGSIRSVRSGVGMEEIGNIGEIPLISDMWGIRSQGDSGQHDVLVASFPTETRAFKFDADAGVEEVDQFCNLEFAESTILAMNLPDNKILQVHDSGFHVSDLESGMSVFQWKPSDPESKITAAAANGAHIVVVENGHSLHVFHSSGQNDFPCASKAFSAEAQISSVAIPQGKCSLCVVSFWQSASIATIDLHSLETTLTQSLGTAGVDVPRSLLVAQVLSDAAPTLFVSMTDGTVITFSFNISNLTLESMTRILLGSEPVFLKTLPRSAKDGVVLDNVFASCEQPSLIYASEGRILYAAINSDEASRVCHFDSEAYPDAVALATPTELKLAIIDTTRTTQIQTLPIGDTVRCLAYQPKLKLFGMATIRRNLEQDDQPREELQSFVKLVDEVTFKEIDSFEFEENELVECICTYDEAANDNQDTTMDDESCKFVVGTSIQVTSDIRSSPEDRGRILVFSVDGRKQKLELVAELRTRGACRSLAVADGLVVAGLVKVIALYSLVPTKGVGDSHDFRLERLAAYRTSTNPISLDVESASGDRPMTIAVGDMMKSISIVEVHPGRAGENWAMEEEARHFASVWTSAIAAVGENQWALADMEGNLIMLRRNPEAWSEEARRLETTGELRLGEIINKIVPIRAPSSSIDVANDVAVKGKNRSDSTTTAPARSGSLVEGQLGPLVRPQAFIATVEGSIYLLGAINPACIDAMLRLQACLVPKIDAPGGMPWPRYRAFKSEVREADEPFRFVDGEVLEQGLLNEPDKILEDALRESGLAESGLTLAKLRSWGEDLRRLY